MSKTFSFDDLSFPFMMDLYRTKLKAEMRQDQSAIQSLQMCYPELFSEKLAKLIEMSKLAAENLTEKYGENFSSIFNPDEQAKISKTLH